ncbi:hypothetical protein BamMEX5DRAFT_0408 [Burkholderia ambifaria MEX-5]|uniref:Uncharacterized protein n=1 Tax=Burkholderia ambifaria MEX-5 TaxID=396597 RepID=B1SXZ2_9BURK|nr:hypothetical protein BamMEX5DRAFT_0408 [Burkholderia ambifaria MEX-5]
MCITVSDVVGIARLKARMSSQSVVSGAWHHSRYSTFVVIPAMEAGVGTRHAAPDQTKTDGDIDGSRP